MRLSLKSLLEKFEEMKLAGLFVLNEKAKKHILNVSIFMRIINRLCTPNLQYLTIVEQSLLFMLKHSYIFYNLVTSCHYIESRFNAPLEKDEVRKKETNTGSDFKRDELISLF